MDDHVYFFYMVDDIQPLLYYKDPIYYTGLATVIGVLFVLYYLVGNNVSSNLIAPFVLLTSLFGAVTYILWEKRCPYCKRPFSKTEQIENKEDLGIKKEAYTYYSQIYQYPDGSTEPNQDSKKTVMRDKKYDRHYYICKKCNYGSNKEWAELSSKWLGEEPSVKYIKKKGESQGFSANFDEESSDEKNSPRKSIPKAVRIDLWKNHFGNEYYGECFVCGKRIDTHNFEAGHIKAQAKGGKDNISNLKPVCKACNNSMKTMNLYEYKNKYYSKKRR